MPTLYPAGLDAPVNPTSTTSMAAPGFEHDLQHININDAMRAVQSYLGTTDSPVATTITYISNTNAANITILQGAVSTLNQQLTITNANVTANTNQLSAHTTSINNLIATKLDLSGGTLGGQLALSYSPAPVSPSLYLSASLLVSNTGAGDASPSIGFEAVGALGIAIYANGNGLNTITGTGGGSLIIDKNGRLNPLSFPDNSLPGSKLVNGSVDTAQLAPGAITGSAIAAGSIDPTKFSSSVYTWCRDNAGCPVGTIALFAGPNTSISYFPNWLPCVGWAISRTAYSTLYAYIGEYWGVGDGSTTFNIPEMRGRFPVGASYYDTNAKVWNGGPAPGTTVRYPGGVGGEEAHTLDIAEIPSHAHAISDPGHAHSVYDPTHAHSVSDPGHAHSVYDPHHSHTTPVPSNSNQPPFDYNINYNGPDGVKVYTPYNWSTNPAGTGVSIYAAGTGIGIYAAGTGIGIYSAKTGIAVSATGGSAAHNTMPPFAGVTYMIKVLPN